jgi:rSAM/selenodomain-associated transferase 2
MRLSVIIPVLNEHAEIARNLPALHWLRQQGHEVIVVDGGSWDHSAAAATPFADKVLVSAQGRARQMNSGAEQAGGDVLLFLHIDTRLPKDTVLLLQQKMGSDREMWGRFDVRLSGERLLFRIIENLMNWRSRITGIATGDQAIFISRSLYEKVGGYADIPLMEDIELCRRLKCHMRPQCLRQRVQTSARRWEVNGPVKTILLMWRLRFAYWLGADPGQLAERYSQR